MAQRFSNAQVWTIVKHAQKDTTAQTQQQDWNAQAAISVQKVPQSLINVR